MHKHPVSPRTEFSPGPFLRPGHWRSRLGGLKHIVLPLLCVSLFAMFSGCTLNLPRELPAVGLPENIYISPPAKDYSGAKVGIFPFASPDIQHEALYLQPPDPGYGAAAALYRVLLEGGIFEQVTMESAAAGPDEERRIRTARRKGYDLFITGRVLYFFEGTGQLPSRVDEEIRVVEVATGQIILFAEAREADPPFIESDRILVRIQGQNAAPAAALMERNATKFSRLLGAVQD